jgi:hypothetical protein
VIFFLTLLINSESRLCLVYNWSRKVGGVLEVVGRLKVSCRLGICANDFFSSCGHFWESENVAGILVGFFA